LFDSGAVIAFGKRVFLFLAVRVLVPSIITDPLLKTIGKFVFIPIFALYALGLLDLAQEQLTAIEVAVGNIKFSVMALVPGLIAGSLLFWLGGWSNQQSAPFIHKQEEMRQSLRQLASKTVKFMIFGIAFLLLMNIMGINLGALAVLGGAVGVGLGFGLQKIAANFMSDVIVRMTARAAILETCNGRWFVISNEDFITTRVVNYSDSGSANRYDVPFSVSYDTDINFVLAIVVAAVAKLLEVLGKPCPPDCELIDGFW
jgi:potassium-dependent mechanosensitive channel